MKQFSLCLLFSILFHVLYSFIGGGFNPIEWGFETEGEKLGKVIYIFIECCIWIVPVMLNYINGDKNFE